MGTHMHIYKILHVCIYGEATLGYYLASTQIQTKLGHHSWNHPKDIKTHPH